MAAPTFKKNRVEQKINLKEEFGVSFKGMRGLREAIGQAIIDRIRVRTDNGISMSFGSSGRGTPGKLKSPYSKSYSDSLAFKAFGKSRNDVNMQLTGDMLGLMDIKDQSQETITIGWDETVENNKAFNHCTGDTLPKRPFFGVNQTELDQLKRDFGDEIAAAKRAQEEGDRRGVRSAVSRLLALLDRNQEEDGQS